VCYNSFVEDKFIEIVKARSHNLKNITCRIPSGKMTVITGVSGSGKSTLAFDTLFAEGQRRYIESLSTYARQFLEKMDRPTWRPSMEFPCHCHRTEKHRQECPFHGGDRLGNLRLLEITVRKDRRCLLSSMRVKVTGDTVESVLEQLMERFRGKRIFILSPVSLGHGQELEANVKAFIKNGYYRIWKAGESLT